METFVFSSIGYNKQLGCYIGGLISKGKTIIDISDMIERSIEVIYLAHQKGSNSIILETQIF